MSRFLCQLDLRLMVDDEGIPMMNRSGEQLWEVLTPLGYMSDTTNSTIIVPEGFVTDLTSIPRMPLVYVSLGNKAQMAAVIHDYLYSTAEFTRKIADKVLLEAMEVTQVPWIQRRLVYAGVRVGGGSHYGT